MFCKLKFTIPPFCRHFIFIYFYLRMSKKSSTFAPQKFTHMPKEQSCPRAKNTEIERKFLVTSDAFKAQAVTSYSIEQGYLSKEPGKTIRIRIRDTRAFLTIKSSTLREGIAKFEWEREIELNDARELMKICLPNPIIKTRYVIPAASFNGEERKWEVDVFHGHKEGLVLAELELGDENEPFDRPEWLGDEVTGLPQYYNANM